MADDDIVWDDEDIAWDDAPPALGRGDFQVAEHKRDIIENARNIPAAMLTHDKRTNQAMAEAAWKRGETQAVTPEDMRRATAFVAGTALSGVAGLPAAMLSSALTSGAFSKEPLKDAAEGAAIGYGVGKYLPKAASYLGGKAIEHGRKALSVALSPLARRKELPEAAVREALDIGAIQPLGTARGAAGRLQSATDALWEEYTALLDDLEAAGVKGPHREDIVRRFFAQANKVEANSMGSTAPDIYRKLAEELRGDIRLPSARGATRSTVQAPATERFTSRATQGVPPREYYVTGQTPPAEPAAISGSSSSAYRPTADRSFYASAGAPPARPAPQTTAKTAPGAPRDNFVPETVPGASTSVTHYAPPPAGAVEKVVRAPKPADASGRHGLRQSINFTRTLQRRAAGDYLTEGVESLSAEARKRSAAMVREAVEDAVASQADKAPEAVARFKPTKEKLHRTLTALGAAAESGARQSRRNPFGLHEAMGLATGLATGHPVEAVAHAGGMSLIRDRLPSTLAWTADKGAKFAGSGKEAQVAYLISLLRSGGGE